VPQIFGGTSASAPFVAGRGGDDEVSQIPILITTQSPRSCAKAAHPGAAPQVTRTLDAYAALRRAAGSIDIVKDPLEINDLDTIPSNLGTAPTYSRANLNIDKRDRDYFRFDSPNGFAHDAHFELSRGTWGGRGS